MLVEYHVVVHSVDGPVVSAATSEKTEVYPGYLGEYPNLQVLVHRELRHASGKLSDHALHLHSGKLPLQQTLLLTSANRMLVSMIHSHHLFMCRFRE